MAFAVVLDSPPAHPQASPLDLSLPTEIISATIIIGFWIPEMTIGKQAGLICFLLLLTALFNGLGSRWFGEAEFWFAMIKVSILCPVSTESSNGRTNPRHLTLPRLQICLILGLIIAGLVVDLRSNPGLNPVTGGALGGQSDLSPCLEAASSSLAALLHLLCLCSG